MKLLKSKKALILSILALSLPAIIEMALNTMLGVADTIMLGHLIDSSAIVSVGFSNQIVFMLIFTFSSFNTGAVALISRAYGEKNYVKLKHIAEQNMLLNLIVGAIMLGISWMIKDSIFKIYDIEPSVLNDAVAYFTIILIGMVPMFLSFSFAAILRGSGNTKTPMYVTGVVNVFNIIGNYVLITGFGPFPEMGIAGAALSTSISRIIAMCIYINKLYIQDSDLKLKLKLFFDKKVIEPLFRISWPGAIEQFLMQLSFVVIGVIVAKLSTDSESLFRILIQIESLSFMPAVGISIAAATLVGKSLGEKDIDKATETGFASAFMGVIWGVIMAVIFILTPDLSIKAFTTEQSIVLLGMPVIPILAVNQPFLNFMIVMGGALRGAGDTRRLMLYTIARLWILFIPLSYLCIIVFDLGVTGVWYAEITSIIVFSTVIFKRFNSRKWASISVE